MEEKKLALLEAAFKVRFEEFAKEHKTDRKNLSELWNRHLKQFKISLIRPRGKDRIWLAKELIFAINHRNEEVSDSVCVSSPDRLGQFLLVPVQVAEKILVLGVP